MLRAFSVLVLIFASLGCKARSPQSALAGSIVRTDLPPSRVYHFGEHRFLKQYGDRDGALTAEEWAKIPSTSSYAAGAAGLYVAQHPAYNEIYGQQAFRARDTSWMMSLDIANSCRGAERVLEERNAVHKDPRFALSNALKSSFGTVERFLGACGEAAANERKIDRCEKVATAFLDELDIKMIKDTKWEGAGFWIIRDPSCVTKIRSSPGGVLWILGSTKELWDLSPFTDDVKRRAEEAYGSSAAMILIRALHELDGIPSYLKERLEAIRGNVQTTELPGLKQAVENLVDKSLLCATDGSFEALKPHFAALVAEVESKSQSPIGTNGRHFDAEFNPWLKKFFDADCSKGAPAVAKQPAPAGDFWVNYQGRSVSGDETTQSRKLWLNEGPVAFRVQTSGDYMVRLHLYLNGEFVENVSTSNRRRDDQVYFRVEQTAQYEIRAFADGPWTVSDIWTPVQDAIPSQLAGDGMRLSNVFCAKKGQKLRVSGRYRGVSNFIVGIADARTGKTTEFIFNEQNYAAKSANVTIDDDGYYIVDVFGRDGQWTLDIIQ